MLDTLLRKFMDLFGWLKRKDREDEEPIVIEDIEGMTDQSLIKEINNDLPHNIRKQVSSHPINSTPKVPEPLEVKTKVEITTLPVEKIIEQPKQEVIVEEPKPAEPPPKPKKRYDDGFTSCRNMY